jgi:hypothetical protein
MSPDPEKKPLETTSILPEQKKSNRFSIGSILKPRRGKKRIVLLAYGAVALTLGVPLFLSDGLIRNGGASFYWIGGNTNYVSGEEIPLELRMRTDGTATNAVQALLNFDPDQIEIIKMTTDKSFCTFFTENSFNNDRGTIKMACGKPNPGFEGDSLVVGLRVRAKVVGDLQIRLDKEVSKILANDGRGSTISGNIPDPLTLSIVPL